MNPNTKLIKILKLLYIHRGKKLSSVFISQKIGIENKQVTPYMNRLSQKINKERINGLNHFELKHSEEKYIKRLLESSLGREIPDEEINEE